MTLVSDDNRIRQFVTTVGLITSDGPYGPNVIAVEWTHAVSYSPGLITVSIRTTDATAANILETKEFGVNLAAEGQNVICSVAGAVSGKSVDKISTIAELGGRFYPASKIKAPMIEGAVMNAECTLLTSIQLGDHMTFVGEVVEISSREDIRPLLYHLGKYWSLGPEVEKPRGEERRRIAGVLDAHRKLLQPL